MSFSDLVKKANEKKDDKEEKKKSSFSSLVEKAYSGNVGTRLNSTQVTEWGSSVKDVIDRAYKYLSTDKYSKADSSLADEISRYASDADDVLQYLRANKSKIDDYDNVYNSYFQMTDAIKKYQKSIGTRNELLSQFDNEKDYNEYMMGWLNPNAETTSETAKARQEYYQSNKNRVSDIEDELPWYAKSWLPNFVEDIFLSKEKEALRDEAEALEADNNKYISNQGKLDQHYIPITNEVAQTASKRDYSNASMEDLNVYDAGFKDVNKYLGDGVHYLDDKGNVVNSYTGKVVRPADEYSKAILNNDTEGFYNSVIQDKLGLFLSASEDELLEAYNRLSASHGNTTDVWANTLRDGDVNGWKQLTEDEITIYYYKLNTEGQEAAYKFLEDMTTELTRRETEQRAKKIGEAGLLEQIAMNVASIPMNVVGGFFAAGADATNLIRGEEINPYSRAHALQNDAGAIRAETAKDLDNLTGNIAIPWLDYSAGDVYQALMSGADSYFGGKFFGSTGYGMFMGMGAASSAAKDLYERGASNGQIVLGSLAAGIAEGIFEKYSIDKFVEMGDAKSKRDFIFNILKQGGVEASEEAFTEIANIITDAMIMGSQANVKDVGTFVKNVVNAALSGFISGGAMGAVGSIGSYAEYAQQRTEHGQDIIMEGGVDTLKRLALDMAGVTQKGESKHLTKLAEKVESKASAKNVGKLSAQMENTIIKQNQADIQKALIEKGLSTKDAKRVAEYLGSSEALTDKQKAEIEGNENIKAVYNELLNNSKSTISERGRNLVAARLGVDTKNANVKASESGELSLKNDVDVKEKISEAGKTTLASTGEEITIDKNNPIAKVKYVDDERIVYYNTDHGTVKASDVKYASETEGLLYESFTDMNPAFANAVIKNYDGSVPIQTYIKGMREGMILYGMHNFKAVGEDISKNSFLAELSESDQAFALKLGKAYAKADAKKASNDLRSAIKNAAEKAEASKGVSTSEATQNKSKKGKVSFEEGAKVGKQHKKVVTLAKHLAKAIGIDIVFYDAMTTTNKNGKDANGYYDPDTDTIYLDLQNAKDDAKTIAFTMSHELVHFIKKWSPQKFNTFAEFLMEQYASHGVSAANLLKQKMVELKTTDADYAYEEMIADACETMLLDSNAMVKLMELRKNDLELFEKIKLHIYKILNDIREAYKSLGYQPSSDEAKALLGMKDVLEKFYSMFEEATVDATKNYQALGTEGYNEFVAKSTENANKTVFGEASVDVGKTESGVKHQLKAHKTVGEASIAYNERHKKVHKAILQVGVESMYEMAEAMLPYLEKEGILPPDIPGKTIFKNGSYGKTGENTTLCVRTLTYEDFKDRVAEKVGRPLTVSESLLVSQKIYDIATEPQCIYCYVAADRKAYDEYLGEYWKAMDKYIKAMRKGGDSKALYTEYLAGRKDTDAQKKRWSQWEAIAKSGKEYISASDLTTKRKRDGIIARKNAFSEQIKDAQRYAQSASWAKTVCDYRAYKGDILKMTSTFVDLLNSEYGLRMYSFSDYTPAFIVENMQMIIDASVKGLKSLAYTKDTDYVEIFASTGQAINVSCFAKWDAELGTYVEDNRQGANWEKTKNLRKQYRNVGAVMVATNDAMVEWALKQDWVDVVIPYHIVKTGTTIANEYQWNNYTSESSDKAGNRAANIYPTEHNNDFATYSDLLNERGITPRFSRWYDMVASGELTEEQYMKLVNEVRLPASELSPVVPSFNLDAAKRSFGIDNEGNVIKGGFVDKGGYMGGWYRQGVDVNQEVMAVSEDIEAGKSSLDVDYGMSKAGKERVEQRYKKQVKRVVGESGRYYGIGVYLDSTLLTNLTDEERIQMVKEYVKELGGSDFIAYDPNYNMVSVHIAEASQVFVNSNGRRVPVNKDLTSYLGKTIKQESIALIDELILTSTLNTKEPSRYSHDWLDNYGKNDWEYWITYIIDKNNTIWEATLNIATNTNGEKILYDIVPIKMVEQSVTSDTSTTIDGEEVEEIDTTSTDNKISQDKQIVKRNLEKNSKNLETDNTKKQAKKNTEKILMGSLFSGGGTLEAGLVYQMLDKEFAVEYNKKIASAYTDNHGKEHMFVGDVRDFNSKEKQDVFYLHASPVCKNYSSASHSGGETTLDITTAQAAARVLEEQMPQVFTVENVKRYIGSEAYNIITNKLDELGYTWDVAVYKASDYGNATKRERMIIRAIKDGQLPEKPQKASNITSWGEATKDLWETDLIPSYLVKSKIEAIKNTPGLKGVKLTKLDKPLLIYDTTKSKTINFAWADELAPTLTTKCGDARIIMPDGRVYAPTPKFMGRIQGLPDDYKYPKATTNAFKIIGNGIPTQLTKAVMGGVLDSAYEQTHDGKVLYQKKKTTNRTLLANALESVAQNDIERTKLTQYKEKISLIETEQEKLAELRGKIKELSFAKGPRDSEAIKKLQFEANQTANRINTYDRQLLNLESTTALKGVLEREKQLAYQKAKKEGKEALDAYREKASKTQRELLTRYQESRKKGIEGRKMTEMRHKIKDVVNELNQYLLKGTKDKHVPIELQKAVAEALDAVNMDTVGAEERIAKKREEMMRAKTPEAIEKLAKEIRNIEEMGGNMANKISRLKTAYDSIINSDDPLIANSHDDVIANTIDKVIEVVGSTPLRDMSLYQLEAVYDMYRMVLHSIRTANKAFKAEKGEEISVLANTVIADLDGKTRNPLNPTNTHFAWNNLKPVYAFEKIGSNTFTKLFNAVREGEDVWARDMSEAQTYREEQSKKYKFDSWDFDKKYPFKTRRGVSFELDLGEMMSIYAFAKDEHSKGHLIGEGFVFDPKKEVVKKVKGKIEVKVNLEDATSYNLSKEIVDDIVSTLTPDQKAFADAMQDYLSTTMGEKGNEVSLELYEIKLFKNKNYFPLKVAPQYMAIAKEKAQGDVKIKNKGFTKDRKEGASNPIVLTSFMDVWATHVNEMSMYHAFTLPLEDFYRVFNYKTPRMEGYAPMSVNASIQNAYGEAAISYIEQLLKDLNGGARVDPTAGIINKLTGLFKKSAVFASASVVIQQPSAIARATALVDTKYFIDKPSGKHKETWAEVKKYAPVAIIKEMGYFDTGMGKSSVEWLKGEKTLKDKIDDLASKAPALADELAWCAIWKAVKRETVNTHKDLKPNSEEFLKAVGERFTEVITKTQVYDSVLSRSANMRSKDTGMKMATAFMGEPTTSINMIENALLQGKRGNKRYARKAIGSVIASMVLNSILVSFVYAGRDDDEDKTYVEKYVGTLTEELLDSINPLTLIPFVKDIVSIVQGYDVERSDMAVITDIINAWNNLDSDNRSVYRKVEDFAGAIASIFGLPVKNIMRDVRAMYNTVNSFINGEQTTGAGIKDALSEAVTGDAKSNGQQLYEAMLSGDTVQIERVKGRFKDQNAINSAIRKALRENDPRIKEAAVARYNGDISEYMRIAKEIIAEGHFKQDDIVAAINSEINAMKKGEETTESSTSNKATSIYKVDDYYAALIGRDQATAYVVKEDLIKTDVANGKDRDEAEADFNSKFTNYLRDKYEEGNLSDYEAEDMLINYGGKTEEEATAKVQYWAFKKDYPDINVEDSWITEYYADGVADSGISIKMFVEYRNEVKGITGEDKKARRMAVINSLPISSSQKDALYFAEGWTESKLWEAPWH